MTMTYTLLRFKTSIWKTLYYMNKTPIKICYLNQCKINIIIFNLVPINKSNMIVLGTTVPVLVCILVIRHPISRGVFRSVP